MPAYATFADVAARAGRYSGAFGAGAGSPKPNENEITQLLADLAALVDVAVRARGYDPDALDATVKLALKDVVAYGALARALQAIPDSSDEIRELEQYASRVWGSAMGDPTSSTAAGQKGSIAAGTHPAIAALEAGEAGGGGQAAGDFWSDEPDFGTPAQVAAELASTPAELAPLFARSQRL